MTSFPRLCFNGIKKEFREKEIINLNIICTKHLHFFIGKLTGDAQNKTGITVKEIRE